MRDEVTPLLSDSHIKLAPVREMPAKAVNTLIDSFCGLDELWGGLTP